MNYTENSNKIQSAAQTPQFNQNFRSNNIFIKT